MEVISSHFSLSFANELAIESFFNSLLWQPVKDFRAPELSLTAALLLLQKPVMLAAPKVIQTHIITLVSEVIGIGMGLENSKPDFRLRDHYVLTFKRSVVLYAKHMSQLQMDGHPVEDRCSLTSTSRQFSQPSFESYVLPVTRKKINHVITKLDDSWNSNVRDRLSRTRPDLATFSIAYTEEIQCILDLSSRDEILSIISCIILKTSSDINNVTLFANGNTSLHDLCLLASLLKLMSISLSQILCCLRHSGNLGCLKTLKNFSSCKEFDYVASIGSCLRELDIWLPTPNPFTNMTEVSSEHKESMLALSHFLRLLSYTFVTGVDFLVKDCIFAIMALMNLFDFEGGNLDALRSLLDFKSESFQEIVVDTASSFVVASKFQKIQKLYLSKAGQNDSLALVPSYGEGAVGMVEKTKETCNGENFLRCILQNSVQSSDIDDLADFIECKQGKDYCSWLKDRQIYRKWKCQKIEELRWKNKRKTWKLMRGKKY